MQTKHIAYALTIAVLLPIVLPNLAFAQYGGAATNSPTLEEQLKLAREKVAAVKADPQGGSGTPFLDPNGLVFAMVACAIIFGALFGVFVLMAHNAKKNKELESRR